MYNSWFIILLLSFVYYINVNADSDGSNFTKTNTLPISNNTDINVKPAVQKTEASPKNVTKTLLSKLSNYCLTKHDCEEIYGNKARFGLVMSGIFTMLMNEATKQIGLNELRQIFSLKPQRFRNVINRAKKIGGSVEPNIEEAVEKTKIRDENFRKNLRYFQKKVSRIYLAFPDGYLWAEDVDVAEKFIDRKFPEIRQIFILRYQKIAAEYGNNDTTLFNDIIIDKMYDTFLSTYKEILEATRNVYSQSLRKYFICNKP